MSRHCFLIRAEPLQTSLPSSETEEWEVCPSTAPGSCWGLPTSEETVTKTGLASAQHLPPAESRWMGGRWSRGLLAGGAQTCFSAAIWLSSREYTAQLDLGCLGSSVWVALSLPEQSRDNRALTGWVSKPFWEVGCSLAGHSQWGCSRSGFSPRLDDL